MSIRLYILASRTPRWDAWGMTCRVENCPRVRPDPVAVPFEFQVIARLVE